MNKFIILITLSFIMSGFARAQILPELEKVKEIKLLEWNRDEVRRIFAGYKSESVEDSDHSDTFNTNDAEIEFSYSKGSCEVANIFSFEAPEWKVIYMDITPKFSIKFKDMGLNLSEYKKEKVYKDVADLYVYHNKDSGIIFRVRQDKVEGIHFMPPQKYYNLMCDQDKGKKLSSTKSLFEYKLKDRSSVISCPAANVEKLNLNRTEIIADCYMLSSKQNKPCSKSIKVIKVFAVGKDPDGDVLTYNYFVTAGKIIGTGEKVLWDLSGVKAGEYKITAAVDDGCGFCGKTVTKTVTVKECPDCGIK